MAKFNPQLPFVLYPVSTTPSDSPGAAPAKPLVMELPNEWPTCTTLAGLGIMWLAYFDSVPSLISLVRLMRTSISMPCCRIVYGLAKDELPVPILSYESVAYPASVAALM